MHLLDSLLLQSPFDTSFVHARNLVIRLCGSSGWQDDIRRFILPVNDEDDTFRLFVGMAADFVRHEIMLGHLLLHGRGLPPVAHRGILDFLTPFRLTDDFERIVHIAFERIRQAWVLLELPTPVVHRLKAFIGQACRQPQFQHLDSGSHFHDKTFVFHRILRRSHAVLHHHAFPCKPLLVSRSTHDLPQRFLHIVVVMREILLTRHIDRIFIRLVMRNTASVRTHGNEIVPHFLQKIIEPAAQPAVVRLGVASFLGSTVLCHRFLVALLVHVWLCRLVDIEKRADLPVVDALELRFLLFA